MSLISETLHNSGGRLMLWNLFTGRCMFGEVPKFHVDIEGSEVQELFDCHSKKLTTGPC